MTDKYKSCELCPRRCKVNRYEQQGYCGMNACPTAAKASLHKWEEPCISFKNGAGTVFFSGCSMHCVFCQNSKISGDKYGKSITARDLGDIYLRLQDMEADNIELVTPTHFLPDVIKSLDMVKHKLNIPVIYNTGGYELVESIQALDGYIDVYMPDIKYFSSELSHRYSSAADYFEYASKAIAEMIRQRGKNRYNDEGGLVSGTIIRHLVLPKCRHDSMKIMDWIAKNTSPEEALVSIMNQYTPLNFIPEGYSELKRRVTKMEYNSVVRYALDMGINGYTQERSSAVSEYIPDFDLSGIE